MNLLEGHPMPANDQKIEKEFRGYYLVNAINRLARNSRAGYLLISLLITVIVAGFFIFLGFEPYIISALIIYSMFFIYFILTRWGNNILIKTRDRLVEKAEGKNQVVVANRLNRLGNRIFHPVYHLASVFAGFAIGIPLVLVMGQPEWMLIPSGVLLFIMIGGGTFLFFGVIYGFHIVGSQIIGELTPILALHPDRMGGHKFIADAMIDFITLWSILIGFAIAALVTFAFLDIRGLPAALILTGGGLTLLFSGYVYLVFDMHRSLTREKEKISKKISPLLLNTERLLSSIPEQVLLSENWDDIIKTIGPFTMPILSLKVILDEVRLMRDWPIDLPMILKLIGGASASLLIIAVRFIAQGLFGIPIP